MTNRPRKRKKFAPSKGSAREKGDILEQAIASMHELSDVKVERNVFLPPHDGKGRPSEIDVLVSGNVAGYPMQIAIECKNEKKPTSRKQINEFIGKLDDVGIPRQQGIFVSAVGFTKDALLRAQGAHIRPLIFKELTKSLPETIREAFQSIIYVLLTITNIQIENDVPGPVPAGEIWFFRNAEGKVCGTVADIIWQEWRTGKITDRLGTHQIDVQLPEGWLQIVNGRAAHVSGIRVDFRITGHAITFGGTVRSLALQNASTQEIEKSHLEVSFERPSGTYEVITFGTEEELENFKSRTEGISVHVGRFRLPRIGWMTIYWPPSERAMLALFNFVRQELEQGRTPDLTLLSSLDIEGTDLRTAWEPIWQEHPSVKNT